MKFFNYLSTLFVPSRMGKRKNISLFVSFAILILASYIIAVPYLVNFNKNAYDVICDGAQFQFKVMDNNKSEEGIFTDAEKGKLTDPYILTTVDELKTLDFKVSGGRYQIPDSIENLKDVPFNGKEYLLKRNVFKFDKDGTKLDDVDVVYLHIVFDIFDKLEDARYPISERFDKNCGDGNHFLLVFYLDGLAYRNEVLVDRNQKSLAYSYGKTEFNFKTMEDLEHISRGAVEILAPQVETIYTFNGFIYTVLAPLILAGVAMIFIKNKNVLSKYKHYLNIAALCTIPTVLLFFAIEWIPFFIQIGVMEFYWLVFGIYYFIVLNVINKTERIE